MAPEVLLGSCARTSTLPACEVRPFRIAGVSGSGRLRRPRPTSPDPHPRTRPRRCAAEGGHSARKDVTGAARVADTPRREPARHGLGVLQRGPVRWVGTGGPGCGSASGPSTAGRGPGVDCPLPGRLYPGGTGGRELRPRRGAVGNWSARLPKGFSSSCHLCLRGKRAALLRELNCSRILKKLVGGGDREPSRLFTS